MLQASANSITKKYSPKPEFNPQFFQDVIDGLQSPRKRLSPKYFYDTEGSHYFDEICTLPEYYPYRTELNLLPQVAHQLRHKFPQDTAIVEFGAGSLKKIQPLLDHLESVQTFIPIDIAKDFLHQQCLALNELYPDLNIQPVAGDFCEVLPIPSLEKNHALGFFPGSTIGNFDPQEARQFLANARETLGCDAHLLVGVDTKKSPQVLHKAYNDEQNVTAKFNLNLLRRINTELDGNFDLRSFEHYAFYNARQGRVEMHLVSKKQQDVDVAGVAIHFDQGESIHTECSYKYSPEEFAELATSAGWETEQTWLSPDNYFSVHLLQAQSTKGAAHP